MIVDDYGGGRMLLLGWDVLVILYYYVDDGVVVGYLEGMKECYFGGRELFFLDDFLLVMSNDV